MSSTSLTMVLKKSNAWRSEWLRWIDKDLKKSIAFRGMLQTTLYDRFESS